MSAVERALQKLRAAAGGDAAAPPARRPIAQVAVDDDAARRPASGKAPRKTINFDIDILRDSWLYSPENQALADQYRVIKRPLLAKASAADGGSELGNIVAVTSALAGEGKTFTSVNLALSIAAEKDWRVVLIDADCKSPQLSRLLGAEKEQGLLDVLKAPAAHIEDARMDTSIPGLSVIPLGTRDDHAAELFSSARMASVCAELAGMDSRRIVIFDTSPLLLTTESSVIAGHCGQIVIVVKAGSTEQQAVVNAVQKIDASKTVGLVLNCASETGDSLHYGSYGAYPHAKA